MDCKALLWLSDPKKQVDGCKGLQIDLVDVVIEMELIVEFVRGWTWIHLCLVRDFR